MIYSAGTWHIFITSFERSMLSIKGWNIQKTFPPFCVGMFDQQLQLVLTTGQTHSCYYTFKTILFYQSHFTVQI